MVFSDKQQLPGYPGREVSVRRMMLFLANCPPMWWIARHGKNNPFPPGFDGVITINNDLVTTISGDILIAPNS